MSGKKYIPVGDSSFYKSLHGNTRRENSLYPLDRRRMFATEGLFPTVPQIYIFVKPAKQVLQSVRILQRRMCNAHDGP